MAPQLMALTDRMCIILKTETQTLNFHVLLILNLAFVFQEQMQEVIDAMFEKKVSRPYAHQYPITP